MRIIVPLVAAIGFCSLGFAQEPRAERREERRNERAAPGVRREAAGPAHVMAGSADQQIAAMLYACSRNEVEISKLAEEKATHEEVRNFAAMMVKEHMPCMEKLQQAAGPLASAHAPATPADGVQKETATEEVKEETPDQPRRERGAKDAPREVRREAAEPRARGAADDRAAADALVVGAQGLDWTMVHKQIADQCLASTKAEFSKKEGAEFDHCYIGQQIMAHMKMVDELKVLRTHASPELRKDLDEASKMAMHHLDHAKKLAESMKGEAGEKTSTKVKAE